jgi:hypothetical protein
MNRSTSSVRHAFIGIVALLAFGAPAAQADVKTFSAGECTVTSNVPGVIDRTALGVMRNTSFVTDGSIACFLARDHPFAKPVKIEVSVVDNSSVLVGVKDISCNATLVGRFGTSSSAAAAVSTSGTNAAGTILNVPIPAAATNNGTLVVQCTIPRRAAGNAPSTVASIKLVEPNPAP